MGQAGNYNIGGRRFIDHTKTDASGYTWGITGQKELMIKVY